DAVAQDADVAAIGERLTRSDERGVIERNAHRVAGRRVDVAGGDQDLSPERAPRDRHRLDVAVPPTLIAAPTRFQSDAPACSSEHDARDPHSSHGGTIAARGGRCMRNSTHLAIKLHDPPWQTGDKTRGPESTDPESLLSCLWRRRASTGIDWTNSGQ